MDDLMLAAITKFGFVKLSKNHFINYLDKRFEAIRIYTEDNYKTVCITWFVGMTMTLRHNLDDINILLELIPQVIELVEKQKKGYV